MCFYNNKKNILAVDDYEDNLFLIQLIFETLGCQVRTACNGREGSRSNLQEQKYYETERELLR